jgi:hypothetical protein
MAAVDTYQAQVAFDGQHYARSSDTDLPARASICTPQIVKGEGLDSKNSGTESDEDDYEDYSSGGPSHVGGSPPRKIRRRRATAQSPAALISHQLQQLANSLSVITSDSFTDGFQRNPAVFTFPPGTQAEEPNFELDPYAPSNHAFLQYEKSLQDASVFLSHAASQKLSRINALRRKRLEIQVADEQRRSLLLKQDLWEQQAAMNQRTEPVVDAGMFKLCSAERS